MYKSGMNMPLELCRRECGRDLSAYKRVSTILCEVFVCSILRAGRDSDECHAGGGR